MFMDDPILGRPAPQWFSKMAGCSRRSVFFEDGEGLVLGRTPNCVPKWWFFTGKTHGKWWFLGKTVKSLGLPPTSAIWEGWNYGKITEAKFADLQKQRPELLTRYWVASLKAPFGWPFPKYGYLWLEKIQISLWTMRPWDLTFKQLGIDRPKLTAMMSMLLPMDH